MFHALLAGLWALILSAFPPSQPLDHFLSAHAALQECRPILPYEIGSLRRQFAKDQFLVVDGGRVLCINGDLMGAAEAALEKIDFSKLKYIVIRSAGGKRVLSRSYGWKIYEFEIDLIIESQCISACANYWLPAARNVYFAQVGFDSSGKRVFGNAFFHGGYYSEDYIEQEALKGSLSKESTKKWKEQARLDRIFYEAVGVDPNISNACPWETNHSICEAWIAGEPFAMWSYSKSRLHAFGVRNLYDLPDVKMSQENAP